MVLTIEPTAVDQNVVLTRTVFLTGINNSFHRIALSKYAGNTSTALTTSQSGEAEPIAASIWSIPVHQIKATSRRTPTAREPPILIVFFLLDPKSIHLKSWIKTCEIIKELSNCPILIYVKPVNFAARKR
jgi:hypothetical protein